MTASDLHRDAVVVDAHHDILLHVARTHRNRRRSAFRERWTADLRAGGVNVQVLPIFLDEEYSAESALRQALLITEYLHREVDDNPTDLVLCLTGTDIDAAVQAGKLALVLAVEGCEMIERDVELLNTFHRLGLRMCGMTWNRRTHLADGTGQHRSGGGLTTHGIEAVREVERLGIILDVSHLSPAGVDHVLEMATRPVAASHSNARALCDIPRNLSDEHIRAIGAGGGVVGVNFFPGFVHATEQTVDRLLDQFEHIAGVAGIDGVGLGPDFIRDWWDVAPPVDETLIGGFTDITETIPGLAYVTDLPAITPRLLERFSEDDVRKILGGNWMRLFRAEMGVPRSTGNG